MRLFTSKQSVKALTTDDKIRQSKYLNKLISEQKETWDQLKAKIDPKKKQLEREFADFVKEMQVKKSELLKEVSDLEARKEAALEPLDAKWYGLSVKEQEIAAIEKSLETKAQKLQKDTQSLKDQAIFLEEKRDELAQREYEIQAIEKRLEERESNIRKGEVNLEHSQTEFSELTAERNLELLDQEKQNSNRSRELDIIADSLDKRGEELDKYKAQLDDRAATLERGFAELRTKQHGQ